MRKTLAAGLLALLLSGCGGYDSIMPPPGTGPFPSIGVTVSGVVSLTRGSTAQVAITVSRTAYFPASIDLSAEGLPAGVTASFAPTTVPGNSTTSTLSLTATSTATLGTLIGAVRAKATPAADATVQLVIGVTQ